MGWLRVHIIIIISLVVTFLSYIVSYFGLIYSVFFHLLMHYSYEGITLLRSF